MEEEQDEDDGKSLSSPFWLQNTGNLHRGGGFSSVFFSLETGLLLLSVAAGVVLILSCRNQIFEPNGVKRIWDSLNIVLVLVAAVARFLSGNRNGGGQNTSCRSAQDKLESYGDDDYYQDEMEEENPVMRRKGRSLFSDLDVDGGNYVYLGEEVSDDDLSFDPVKLHCHRRHRSLDEVLYQIMDDEAQSKSGVADSPPLKSSRQCEEDLEDSRSGRTKFRGDLENTTYVHGEQSTRRLNREIESSNPSSSIPEQKSSETVIKDFSNSLYYKKKRRRRSRQQKSVDNLEPILHEAEAEDDDIDRTESGHATPPLPPRPPRSTESTIHNAIVPNGAADRESPFLIRTDPAPPQPPPSPSLHHNIWKFVAKGGDYARLDSDAENPVGSGETTASVQQQSPLSGEASAKFCQSPDVNTKAESFITNFRAKLKLERIHSLKKRDL